MSIVWQFYTKVDKRTVRCNTCKKILLFSGGTTNLRNHVERMHLKGFEDMSPFGMRKDGQLRKLESVFQPSTSSDSNPAAQYDMCSLSPNQPGVSQRHLDISVRLAECVVKDLWPVSLLKGAGFQDFLSFIEPDYALPADADFVKLLQSKYMIGVQKLKQMLALEPNFIGLNVHIWESVSERNYLTTSVQFVDSMWNLQKYLLSTQCIEKPQSKECVVHHIRKVLEQFSIDESKVLGMVCNKEGIVKTEGVAGFREPSWSELRCVGSDLKACLHQGFLIPEIQQALSTARRFVSHMKHDPKMMDELHKHQQVIGTPEKNLILDIDVNTDWNSSYAMLATLLEQRWAVSTMIANTTMLIDDSLKLDNDQWDLLTYLFMALEPFKVVFDFFNSKENVTISSIYPVLSGLVRKLDNADSNDSDSQCNTIKIFKRCVSSAISQRWDLEGEMFAGEPDITTIATVLDPRFKHLKFLSDTKKQQVWAHLQELLQSHRELDVNDSVDETCDDSPSYPDAKRCRQSLYCDLLGSDSDSNQEDDAADSIQSEINKYQQEKRPSRDSNPLYWWTVHKVHFPTIASLAARYLCLQCVSSPPETSVGKSDQRNLRFVLDSDTLDSSIFLHANRCCDLYS